MSAGHATRRARLLRNTVALAVVLAAVVVVAPTAASAASADGNWWYERYGIAEVQADGWDGSGVKVAVIDAVIDPTADVFAGAKLDVPDPSVCGTPATAPYASLDHELGHGTEVTALLVGSGQGTGAVRGIAPKADVSFYALGRDGQADPDCVDENGTAPWARALDRAVEDGAKVVSISLGDIGPIDADSDAILNALRHGVIVVAALPNEPRDSPGYPVGYNGVVSVAAFQEDGAIMVNSEGVTNVWPEATVVAAGSPMASVLPAGGSTSGTSLSTPLVAGMLAVTWQKYPDATANQLLQSLIHNTGADDHALERDTVNGYGYGPASLRHMLRVDPTQYPDVNPLVDKESGVPSAEEIAAATPDASSLPTPSTTGEPGGPSAGSDATPWIVGGGIAVVVLGAVAVIIVVAVRRRASKTNGGV